MQSRYLVALTVVALVAIGAARLAEPTDPMAKAASELLASLDEAQRSAITFDFDDAERRNWQATPMGDAGVRLGDMTETQREEVRGLLKSALSEEGLKTVAGVIVLEEVLVAMEETRGQGSRFHGPERYFISIYGNPESSEPWGWRMEGHHLSITFTCVNDEWTAHGPIFIGSQPARVRGGEHDGLRLLGQKDDNMRSFLAALSDEQRSKAVLAGRLPGNIILLPGRDHGFAEPMGLPGSEMTDAQRAELFTILKDWANWLRVDLAEAEIKRMESALAQTRFAWMGATGVDEPHYWRIVGRHFAIEYAAPERDPDHVHAIWRNLENDFGGDLLKKHLEEHHSEGDGQ